jgi:hypothetical protein
MAIPAMLMMAPATALVAQTPDDPAQHIAFHIDGFSSTERDAIAVEIATGGQFRMSYACVPAGILVIERVDGAMDEAGRADAESLVQHHIQARAITPLTTSMADVEAQCVITRDR